MLIGTQSIKFASVFSSNLTPYDEISVELSEVHDFHTSTNLKSVKNLAVIHLQVFISHVINAKIL